MSNLVSYNFPYAINAFFEIPTDVVRKFLPVKVEPIEPFHGTSLLAVTLFEFDQSPIGPYQEVVLSLFVTPQIRANEQLPHAAVAPLILGSTNNVTRDHAIDLWHLPHYMNDIYLKFTPSADGQSLKGEAFCKDGKSILELTVSHSGNFDRIQQQYQSFQGDQSGQYLGIIDWDCELSEHEEGTGIFKPNLSHEFFKGFDLTEMSLIPHREMWMKDGVEAYHPIRKLS